MIQIFSMFCSDCNAEVRVEVSVGTHRVRVLPVPESSGCSTQGMEDTDCTWIQVRCPECTKKNMS